MISQFTPLSKICSNISRKFSPPKNNKVWFINTGDVLNGKFLHNDISDWSNLPGQAKKAIEENDILYSEIRPGNGRFAFVFREHSNAVVSTKFMVIKSSKGVYPRYLYHYLTSPRLQGELKRIADSRSGTFPQITFDSISHLEIRLPEIEEQTSISNFLDYLQNKIEINEKTNETLEQIAKALFKSWFIDFDPVKAKAEGRSTGLPNEISNLFPDSYKDSEFGKIPKGWSLGEIQDLCDWVSSGGTPSRSNKEYWNNGNISWFKTGELNDSLLFDSLENINELAIKNSSCKLWEKGTILFAIYASPTVGRLGVLTKNGTCNQAAAGLKAKEEIGTAFLRRCLLFSRKKLQNIAVGAAQQNINVQILKQHQIIIPNNNLSSLYSNLMMSLDSKQELLLREILHLEELRDTLLPKLLSGELRIPDAEKMIEEVGI